MIDMQLYELSNIPLDLKQGGHATVLEIREKSDKSS